MCEQGRVQSYVLACNVPHEADLHGNKVQILAIYKEISRIRCLVVCFLKYNDLTSYINRWIFWFQFCLTCLQVKILKINKSFRK